MILILFFFLSLVFFFFPAEGICNMTMDSNSMTMPMSDPNAWATAMNNLGMPPIGMTGQQLMPGSTQTTRQQPTTDTLCLKSQYSTGKDTVLWCCYWKCDVRILSFIQYYIILVAQ